MCTKRSRSWKLNWQSEILKQFNKHILHCLNRQRGLLDFDRDSLREFCVERIQDQSLLYDLFPVVSKLIDFRQVLRSGLKKDASTKLRSIFVRSLYASLFAWLVPHVPIPYVENENVDYDIAEQKWKDFISHRDVLYGKMRAFGCQAKFQMLQSADWPRVIRSEKVNTQQKQKKKIGSRKEADPDFDLIIRGSDSLEYESDPPENFVKLE